MKKLIEELGVYIGEEATITDQKLRKIVSAMLASPRLKPLLRDVDDMDALEVAALDAVKPVVARLLDKAGLRVPQSITTKSKRAIRMLAKESYDGID